MLRLWGGLWVTLRLSLISIALSLVIGVFVGALMLVKNPVVKVICRVYIEIVRIMPQLVWLFIIFFGITKLTKINLSGDTAAVIMLTIWGASEVGDLVRSAFQSIPSHQFESRAVARTQQTSALFLRHISAGSQRFGSRHYKSFNPYDQDHRAGFAHRRYGSAEGRKADH